MILLIIILGIILRLITLNQSLWLDEAISVLTAQRPFPLQWTGIGGDFQPPLYYLLMHFFMKIPVREEWFLRLPSVFFGAMAIPALYVLVKEKFDRRTALVAAVLLSTSQFHIYYSQELRMYSLLCLLSILSMWLFDRKKWIFFTLVTVLGMYTSYMFFFLAVGQLAWLICRYRRDRSVWGKWFLSQIISLILFIPWLPNMFEQLMTGRRMVIQLPLWNSLSSLPAWKLVPQIFLKFTWGRINFDNKLLYLMLFLAILGLFGYIFRHARKKVTDGLLFSLIWFSVPITASILFSFFLPVSGVWRYIFLLPPFIIAVADTVLKDRRWKWLLTILLIINFVSCFSYFVFPKFQREQWRQAVGFVESRGEPLVFTVSGGFAPYTWYKRKELPVCSKESLNTCLIYPRINYFGYLGDLFDPGGDIPRRMLQAGFRMTGTKDFPGVGFIYSYSRQDEYIIQSETK